MIYKKEDGTFGDTHEGQIDEVDIDDIVNDFIGEIYPDLLDACGVHNGWFDHPDAKNYHEELLSWVDKELDEDKEKELLKQFDIVFNEIVNSREIIDDYYERRSD